MAKDSESKSRSGRPVGTRFPAPQNPDRVRRILTLREDGFSFEQIGQDVGISRVAVRLLYIRWKDDPWATGRLPVPDSRLPSVISPSVHS